MADSRKPYNLTFFFLKVGIMLGIMNELELIAVRLTHELYFFFNLIVFKMILVSEKS